MTSGTRKILQHALVLSEVERRQLGEAILDSVPRLSPDGIQQAWVDEARRRTEEIERGEVELLDLDHELMSLRSDLRAVRER